jgi:hypothetical protein
VSVILALRSGGVARCFGFVCGLAAGGWVEKSGIPAVSGVSLPKRQAAKTSSVRIAIAAKAASTTLVSKCGPARLSDDVLRARSGVSSSTWI